MKEKNASDFEIEKLIDSYINGDLSDEEAESLWVELIKHPEYLDHLEMEITLKEVIKRKEKGDIDSPGNPGHSR